MSSQNRILIAVLVGSGLIAAAWFGVLAPKQREAERASAQLATEQARLDKARTAAAHAGDAKRRYLADYAAVATLGKAVPAEEDVPTLMYEVQSAARGARIDFASIAPGGEGTGSATAASTPGAVAAVGQAEKGAAQSSPGSASAGAAPASTAGPSPLPFTFVFNGSFLDMQRLLGRLDDFVQGPADKLRVNGRLLSVNDVNLTASSGAVQASITATAYTMPAAKTPAGATAQSSAGASGAAAQPAGSSAPIVTATAGGVTP
ncbi:MAG TPA: hypothetical protein VHF51_16105 [Solirubrobacteraceae bacterium]|nr:hypothetical protein [Solirubrobacteraceae bacterium]